MTFDLGNVLIRWDPATAIARGVGEEEARRFLAEFDFLGWNHPVDEGADPAEVLRSGVAEHPRWAPHMSAYWAHFPASLVGEIEGSVVLLRELHAAGVPLFALTNWGNGTFHHARERFDWLGLFRDIVVSGEVGLAKPDPAVFEELARRTGVPLRETFFTDDTPGHVEAARRLGMTAVVFTSPGELRADLAALGLVTA